MFTPILSAVVPRWRTRDALPGHPPAVVSRDDVRAGGGARRDISDRSALVRATRREWGRRRTRRRRALCREHGRRGGRCARRGIRVDSYDRRDVDDESGRGRERGGDGRRVPADENARERRRRSSRRRRRDSTASYQEEKGQVVASATCGSCPCPPGWPRPCSASQGLRRSSSKSPGRACCRSRSGRRSTRSRRRSRCSSAAWRSDPQLARGWPAGRESRRCGLRVVLAGAAMAASWACTLAGGEVPRRVAEQVAASPDSFDQLLTRGAMLIAALIFPTAAGLGASFPLAFAMLGTPSSQSSNASRLGLVYAINTVGAVAGSLLAGIRAHPDARPSADAPPRQRSPLVATLVVVLLGAIVGNRAVRRLAGGRRRRRDARAQPALGSRAPGERRVHLRAYAPKVLDLESALKAGTLLYYREGASATVSVKRLTGTLSLAIDGKVDASTRSDMLTQKLVAHLPLLLHPHPEGDLHHRPWQRRQRSARRFAIRLSTRTSSSCRPKSSKHPDSSPRRTTARPRRSAHAPHRRRRTLAPAAVEEAIRRHHFRAVESLDCRRRLALHARVLLGRARSPRSRAASSASGRTRTTSAIATCGRLLRRSRRSFRTARSG